MNGPYIKKGSSGLINGYKNYKNAIFVGAEICYMSQIEIRF